MAKEPRKPGRPPLRANEVKNIKYTIRVDQELNERLKAQANSENTTITNIVRQALKKYLDNANNLNKDK